ncbi:MAG: toprim domain-containing protein, partial [Caulobacter sp.]|nr:toprim domain-containing protein [Caulobacter sp.]
GHSAADRSVSLLLKEGRIIVHTFGDGDWRAVLDHLRGEGLVDAHNAPTTLSQSRRASAVGQTSTTIERLNAARRIWEVGKAVPNTLSERHCRLRAITRALPGPQVLRHCGHAPVSAYATVSRHHRPALLVGVSDATGAFTAVEVTYLAPNAHRAADLRLNRKTVGAVPAGAAVRIDEAAPEMLVAEGFFTTLSASERFSLPAWSLMSTRNLRSWIPPPGVRSVLIAADRGKDGAASAQILAARLQRQGVAARIEFPPEPFGDWNDVEAALRA